MIVDSATAPADAANVAGAVLADLVAVAVEDVAVGEYRVELLRGDLPSGVPREQVADAPALFDAGFLATFLTPLFLELFDSSRY